VNRPQRIIIFLGLLAVAGFCLRPPCRLEQTAYLINRESRTPHKATSHARNIGHRWIWHLPQGSTGEDFQLGAGRVLVSSVATVDWQRQGVYVGLAFLATLFGAFVFTNKK